MNKNHDENVIVQKAKRYVFLYVAKPYSVGIEDQFERDEVKSVGRKNAWAVRVGLKKDYGSFAAFIEKMKNIHIKFDEEAMSFEFDNLYIDRTKKNALDGKENVYPYDDVYNAPWIKSAWGEPTVNVTVGGKTYVMDFDKLETYEK